MTQTWDADEGLACTSSTLVLYTALYEGHTELSNAKELHVSAVCKRIGCSLIVGAKNQRTGKPLIAPNDLTAFLFTLAALPY